MKTPGYIAAILAACTLSAQAALRPATPFADNMVLQRERPVPVWGTADAGSEVSVSFAGQTKTAKADEDGKWRVDLDAMETSKENRTMTISAGGQSVELKNILVGEVWFASGQSNMECPIWGANPRYRDGNGAMMVAMTRRPFIRFAKNPRSGRSAPRYDIKAVWRDFSPESFRAIKNDNLSAVAFYYALELEAALDIPIGIVDSTLGGTHIEPWTPASSFGETLDKNAVSKSVPASQRSTLWNGMVAAWTPMAMRGFIWYQGCSDQRDDRETYFGRMRRLYDGWAREFENPGLKFYFAQLAPFSKSWYEVQLAQAAFAATEPNSAIASTCDVGNFDDVHPNRKEIVAKRLAIHALKRDYGFSDIVDDPPVLRSWRIDGDKFILSFDNASAWYVYRADHKTDVPGFEIAGADGVFQPASIQNVIEKHGLVDGAQLVLSAQGVAEPKRLRYLASAPWTGVLYSSDSALPMGPFEIDASDKAEGPFGLVGGDKVRNWFDSFSTTDNELYTNTIPNAAATDWALDNIPRFECPDAEIERTYYFRWWTYRKHLRNTKDGWVVTEFLPNVPWAAGNNTISCALNHHVAEGKWLRNQQYIDGYLRFMMERGRIVGSGSYSCAPAYAALERAKVTGDFDFAKSLLPLFAKNCEAWEKGWRGMGGNFFIGYRPERGLYDIYGEREGTEYNLSASGARPMVNSMRWADMDATAKLAAMAGDVETAAKFSAKADALAKAVKEQLWNKDKMFFTTLSIKGGKDGVCELHGYAPWYFGMPVESSWSEAFARLLDEKGFLAPKGLTFPTRDTPNFKQVPNLMGHECQWNGPSWPYATSVALTALVRELKAGEIPGVDKEAFTKLMKQYASQHTLTRADGKTVPWIDEDYDPFTGEWLARKVLLARAAAKGRPVNPPERGKDYNHSTFCDLVISGICGIGADAEGKLEVKPLAPESWDWWCIEGVRWHGRDLTVLFDRDGTHYGKGKGLQVFF